jgi:hypothetical protein
MRTWVLNRLPPISAVIRAAALTPSASFRDRNLIADPSFEIVKNRDQYL